MTLHVDIQTASDEPVPDEDDLRGWIAAAIAGAHPGVTDAEIGLRLVDTEEMARLNETYRGGTGPTNVLSFVADLPADLPDHVRRTLLGDIVICAPVVRDEAAAQGKTPEAHWAHMAVHGTLHLLGYDHIEEHEAAAMEALESRILGELSFPCPYGDANTEH